MVTSLLFEVNYKFMGGSFALFLSQNCGYGKVNVPYQESIIKGLILTSQPFSVFPKETKSSSIHSGFEISQMTKDRCLSMERLCIFLSLSEISNCSLQMACWHIWNWLLLAKLSSLYSTNFSSSLLLPINFSSFYITFLKIFPPPPPPPPRICNLHIDRLPRLIFFIIIITRRFLWISQWIWILKSNSIENFSTWIYTLTSA